MRIFHFHAKSDANQNALIQRNFGCTYFSISTFFGYFIGFSYNIYHDSSFFFAFVFLAKTSHFNENRSQLIGLPPTNAS